MKKSNEKGYILLQPVISTGTGIKDFLKTPDEDLMSESAAFEDGIL